MEGLNLSLPLNLWNRWSRLTFRRWWLPQSLWLITGQSLLTRMFSRNRWNSQNREMYSLKTIILLTRLIQTIVKVTMWKSRLVEIWETISKTKKQWREILVSDLVLQQWTKLQRKEISLQAALLTILRTLDWVIRSSLRLETIQIWCRFKRFQSTAYSKRAKNLQICRKMFNSTISMQSN